MTPNRRRSLLLFFSLALLGFPAWLTYHQMRQDRLNRALLKAVKQEDDSDVIVALDAGADPNIKDLPPEARPLWKRLWETLNSKHTQPPQAPTAFWLALGYYYPAADAGGFTPPFTLFTGLDPPSPKLHAETIEHLLQHGADANAKAPDETTLLMMASQFGDSKLVSRLLAHGAQINAGDAQGATALVYAIRAARLTTLDILLQHGANTEVADNFGDTPLAEAVQFAPAQIIRRLLKAGALVNAHSPDGKMPLHYAAQCGNTSAVKLLLANHAEVNAKDEYEQTPLGYARDCGDSDVVRLLKQAGAKQ